MSRFNHENDNENWDTTGEVLDEADQASILQMNETNQALASVKAKLEPETHPDFDGKHCVDCDNEIPKARLAMGRVRCVHCQGFLEAKGRLFVKHED